MYIIADAGKGLDIEAGITKEKKDEYSDSGSLSLLTVSSAKRLTKHCLNPYLKMILRKRGYRIISIVRRPKYF